MYDVITLGKLIGLLFLFCPPLLSNMFNENSKNTGNDIARPVMGTIFVIYHAKSRLNTPGVWLTSGVEDSFIGRAHSVEWDFAYKLLPIPPYHPVSILNTTS